jgi:hypothetical protein
MGATTKTMTQATPRITTAACGVAALYAPKYASTLKTIRDAGTAGIVLASPDELTWESNPALPPLGTSWTPFSGNERLTFLLPADAGIPANATVLNYWSYESAQAAPQVNNVNTAGQLAEYSDAGTGSITVYNSACASYFLRVVVQFLVPEADVGGGGAVDATATGTDVSEEAVDDPPGG